MKKTYMRYLFDRMKSGYLLMEMQGRIQRLLQGKGGKNPKAVAAGLLQPQHRHDLHHLELLWSWVEHGSLSHSRAHKET